jgi:hypothetical protein
LREENEALAGGVGSESLGKTVATISYQARIFGYMDASIKESTQLNI